MMNAKKNLLVVFAVSLAFANLAFGAKPQINGTVAIKGYDPVAYFESGAPLVGNKSTTFSWRGSEWRFSSTANRDKFAADPEKFAPQYGGYCAWAVGQGYTAPIDPAAWRIVDGKLYLNYDKKVQKTWEKDIPGHISKANANWPKVLE